MVHRQEIQDRVLWTSPDEKALAFSKPPGLISRGQHEGAATFWVRRVLGETFRPVHSLDRDTSGILLFGRDRASRRQLHQAFERREVEKEYTALVHGDFPRKIAGIICNLRAHRDSPLPVEVNQELGKKAVSSFRIRDRLNGLSLLNVGILTGRTHQIRAHLAHLGFPIVGDTLYGGGRDSSECQLAERHMLHAHSIAFPYDDEITTVTAPLEEDFQKLLDKIAA